MIFLADANISPQAAKLLEVFDRENDVRTHKDCFAEGTPDPEWLREVGTWEPKPAVLAGDGRILKNPSEVSALKSSNLTFIH